MAIGRFREPGAMGGSGEGHFAGAGSRPGRRFTPVNRPGRSPAWEGRNV